MRARWSIYAPFASAADSSAAVVLPAEAESLQPDTASAWSRPLHRIVVALGAAGLAAVGVFLVVVRSSGMHPWGPRPGRVQQLQFKAQSFQPGVQVIAGDKQDLMSSSVVKDELDQLGGIEAQRAAEEAGEDGHERFMDGVAAQRAAEDDPSRIDSRPHEVSMDTSRSAKEDTEYGSSEWEVIYPTTANVRAKRDVNAEIVATKPTGTFVVGRRWDNWLALINEPGYMAISLQDTQILKRRSVSYSRVLRGACSDVNKFPIWDADTCQNAGFALGYFDSLIGIYHGELDRPEGCYEVQGQLWLATNPIHAGKGAVGNRKPICSSHVYPTTTTTTLTTATTTVSSTTITTKTTTTSTTTTWGYPSLFCIEVVRMSGYEFPLVQAQQRVRASIFSCDEYRVFSDGGVTHIIGIGPDGKPIRTIVIPRIVKKKMALDLKAGVTTDSWLNTETFLQVWTLANKEDGRLLYHDWVVKVDPDAVFFPERLRARLRSHTFPGANKFVMNCDKYNPVALYGSLEIFSNKAMKTFLDRQLECRNKLPWHGWGEDFFMSHCMDFLHVQRIYDFTLIGDARCHYASCGVTSKVVYHDYKNKTSWFQCWEHSRRMEHFSMQ